IHAGIRPALRRLLALDPRAAAGDASAPAEIGALVTRIKRIGQVQVVIGLVIVFVMVLARFS
ncbi:MAG: hypothetical protein ACRDF0_04005, partial [Candidatus Limnocylindria bacterium]